MDKDNLIKSDVIRKISPVIERAAEDSGLILLEVDFVKDSNQWFLKIFIYVENRAITHKDCEKITKKLDEHLDQLIPVPYYLEISSPGTERKLKSVKEYTIFKGERVKIKLKKALEDLTKTINSIIIKYKETTVQEIKIEPTDEIIHIEDKNISSIKLSPKYKL